MKRLDLILILALTSLLIGCESGELGMKITVTKTSAPAPIPTPAGEATAGTLQIGVTGGDAKNAQTQAETVAKAVDAAKAPEGVLTFTQLSVINPSTEHPPQGSAEIHAKCIWEKAGKSAVAFEIKVETFSIPFEDPDKDKKYLRDEAIKGMVKKLLKEL